jgi:tRNA-2-methylthio-N6-dimethylallyladenosine synthase
MGGPPQLNSGKTFYLETFGCQMNVHDSEKVIGTLLHEGYRQVGTVEEADLILYNTCSIRDKAEQKVFYRLADYKKLQAQGKTFGVLGCVAQQEGEKIFERAPHVSLVCGSASYRKLPQMLVQLAAGQLEKKKVEAARSETGERETAKLVRITGLDDRQTDECFETEFTARTNPYRGYITIIEGCDKFCSYCVVPFTRGKERSRTPESVLAEARQMADLGYSEIQLLGQNVNSYKDPAGNKSFAELLAAVGEVPGIRRVRFTTSHPRDFGRDIVEAIDTVPTLCDHVHLPVQSGSTRVLDAMQRLYNREQYLERIAWIKAAKRDISITTDMIVGFPGETEADFEETLSLLDEVGYDSVFTFKYSPRPNTPSLSLEDAIPDAEKARRLEVIMGRQREIQIDRYKKYVGATVEVMVEGVNAARGQWIGRTSQNKTLNFAAGGGVAESTATSKPRSKATDKPALGGAEGSVRPTQATSTATDQSVCPAQPVVGSYCSVRVTASFPNSLVGEMI